MALFRKKKIERPKSPLGSALYDYDLMIATDLKKVLDGVNSNKKLDARKVSSIFKYVDHKFTGMLNGLSKENLKVDYRSDKIRYLMIDMIGKLKAFLNTAKTEGYDPLKEDKDQGSLAVDKAKEIREIIRRKMKDIESDYI
ncbi:MAG: hypothetical protein PHQ09_04095 [Actinomycetota bacterium]|nr:hypothetical protein [Actinomycetota bacterium]